MLLEAGAGVNEHVADRHEFMALHLAVRVGHNTFLQSSSMTLGLISDRGSQTVVGLSILPLWGFHKLCRVLAGKGLNVNSKNNDGVIALHFAAIAGHADEVAFLFEKKIDVEVVGGRMAVQPLICETNMRSNILHSIEDRARWEELAEALRKL